MTINLEISDGRDRAETVLATVDVKEFERAIEASIESRIRIFPHRSIWASQLGHPCARQQEYHLTDILPQKHPASLQEIFEEGHLHEKAVRDKLEAAGFKTRQSGRPLDEKVRANGKEYKYHISGRLDLELTHPELLSGKWYSTEIKSAAPYTWGSVESVVDMLNHRAYYVRVYPLQLMIYLYVSGQEVGLMILKNKVTGRLKFIWVYLDLEIMEKLLKRAEEINEAVEKIEADRVNIEKYLTERIPFDDDICGGCPFNHVCLPEQHWGGETIELSEQVEADLKKWAKLKEPATEFKNLDEKLKGSFKVRGVGKYLVGANFDVRVKEVQTTKDGTPKEIKEQYAIPNSYLKVDIKQLNVE